MGKWGKWIDKDVSLDVGLAA